MDASESLPACTSNSGLPAGCWPQSEFGRGAQSACADLLPYRIFRRCFERVAGGSPTNPNNHLAVYRTAQTFAFQGKYEAALAVLRAIPRDINPSLIGYQTAWVLFNLGRKEEASELIDQLLMAYPEDDGALFVSMQAVFAAAAGDRSSARGEDRCLYQDRKGLRSFPPRCLSHCDRLRSPERTGAGSRVARLCLDGRLSLLPVV